MKYFWLGLALLAVSGGVHAQSKSRTRVSLKKNPVLEALKGDYRLNMNMNSSRIAGNFGEGADVSRLRKTALELNRVFKYRGWDLESGLSYETVGTQLNSVDAEVTYFTIPFLVRNKHGKLAQMDVVSRAGVKLGILSKAEIKADSRDDIERTFEDYDRRWSVGLGLESKSPKTLGFSAGLQWDRSMADIVDGPSSRYLNDIVQLRLGFIL